MENAVRQHRLTAENNRLRTPLTCRPRSAAILGRSKKLGELFDLVDAVATSDANILIQGENGTGKELMANAIHQASARSGGPFVKINCAAIPHGLFECELFGCRKGAFTGAVADRDGLLKIAQGGSVLLDEIMVAEDDDDSTAALSAVLRLCGCQVRAARTAAECLRLLSEWRPDVLVCDIGLPDDDGYSLLRRARNTDGYAAPTPRCRRLP